MTFDELVGRRKNLNDEDARIMWIMLAQLTTHPRYSHLTPCDTFDQIWDRYVEEIVCR